MDIIDQNLVVRDWPLKEPGDEAFFGYVVAVGVFPRNGQGNYFFGYVDFFYRDHYFRYRLPQDKNLINELLEHFAMNMETVLERGSVQRNLSIRFTHDGPIIFLHD